MRIVFDEHVPHAVAHAVKIIVDAENAGVADPIEVGHAPEQYGKGLADATLIERVSDRTHTKAALITSDKMMRTRQHERDALRQTGCIGIVLRGWWAHASPWERAELTLRWWTTWVETVEDAPPGTLWQCPWSTRLKRLDPF